MPRTPSYNNRFTADQQISAEEAIAQLLFDGTVLSESRCAALSRLILLVAVRHLRPDLLTKPRAKRR